MLPNRTKRIRSTKRQILVVDDEEINRQLLGFMLESDYQILYAENGKEALQLITENQDSLSLILLDLMMPVMDGYEVLQTIQKDRNLRRIPVIVLTSEKSAEVKSLQMGAADFIPKPYDMPEVIRARVHRSIELAEDSSLIHATEDDPLTGLAHKDFFLEYCHQRDQFDTSPMDALVLNVNRFHLANEIHGRAFGDKILLVIAGQIAALLNQTGGLACRSGADSFYLYLPHRDDYNDLLCQFSEALEKETGTGAISLRMGVYPYVDRALDMEQRFDRANLACAPLRTQHISQVSVYDMKTHEKEVYAEKLLEDIDTALSDGQFQVYYQPKYDIRQDKPKLCSAEALVRWFHPVYGMISPGVFIPLFEENGLIHKLDLFVWNATAAQLRIWKEEYRTCVPISVNVSRIDLLTPGFEENLLSIVRNNALQPEDLLLEITESAYTEHIDQILETIHRLRNHGFRIEMDDFGSGYSSLNVLSSFPVDALKLDMKFVRTIDTNEKAYGMLKIMMSIAAFLEVPVIAEGVETEKQLSLLRDARCDIVQGYYFSKPVPADSFTTLLGASGRKEKTS